MSRSTTTARIAVSLASALGLLTLGCAVAPGGGAPSEVADPEAPPAGEPAGGASGMPEIDEDVPLPTGSPGSPEVLIRPTAEPRGVASDGWGAFRTVCEFSHMNYDDPIVYPGQPGRSHLHAYFGNTGTDASTTAESLATTGNGTCRGGIANRSAYWVPAMVDTRTDRPITPTLLHAYYKSGFDPGLTNQEIATIPPGLRMIAGDPGSAEPFMGAPRYSPESYSVGWGCWEGGTPNDGSSIPDCPEGNHVAMSIHFPRCWDGVNLDSPDHRSHVDYPRDGRCTAEHPVVLPSITMHVLYEVTADADPSAWRLASDMYPADRPAGYSIHADWFNGWDPEVARAWTQGCLHAVADCHSHLLGDGREIHGAV